VDTAGNYICPKIIEKGVYFFKNGLVKITEIYWLFSPTSIFMASSTSAIPGSASFQRERNFWQCSMALPSPIPNSFSSARL